MAYNFKNLNEVDRQDKPTENTTVMAFEAGQPKQIPASEFGGKGLVVDLRGYTISDNTLIIDDMNYDPIYEAITAGQYVVFQIHVNAGVEADGFGTVMGAVVLPGTGFIVTTAGNLQIVFTNGSYHTTT